MKNAILVIIFLIVVAAGVLGYIWFFRNSGGESTNTNIAVDECLQNVVLESSDQVKTWVDEDQSCRGNQSYFAACRGDLTVTADENNWRIYCPTFDGGLYFVLNRQGGFLGQPLFIQSN